MIALLVTGSAILLYSCNSQPASDDGYDETMMTEQCDSLNIIQTRVGNKEFVFKTPLMERYELAKEPYMEFRKGIVMTTFNDSTGLEESSIVADYAIFYEKRQLWEAKGNVVGKNAKGQTLYTQQLFWNQITHRVYSNVDSKVQQGEDVFVGEGFESDDSFNEWSFRKFTGKLTVDTSVTDSTKKATPTVAPVAPAKPTVAKPSVPTKSLPRPTAKAPSAQQRYTGTPVKR